MLTREPETFWWENVITVVVLLRILPNMSLRRKQFTKCNNFYHTILRPGKGLTSWFRAAASIAGVRGFEFRWGLYLSYSQWMFLIEVCDRLFTILFFAFFSQSLSTLSVIEEFLSKRVVPFFPGRVTDPQKPSRWARNKSYFREFLNLMAWEKHFLTSPLVFPRNDVWETSAEIPYWWRVTTQIWVVLLIGWKFASANRFSDVSRGNQ